MGSRSKVIRVTTSDTESAQFLLIRQADSTKMLRVEHIPQIDYKSTDVQN